jgi:hypothetical protein
MLAVGVPIAHLKGRVPAGAIGAAPAIPQGTPRYACRPVGIKKAAASSRREILRFGCGPSQPVPLPNLRALAAVADAMAGATAVEVAAAHQA